MTTTDQAPERAIVLLSGGLDSTTVLAIAREKGFEVHALTFDYGQRHAVELRAARRAAEDYGVARHFVVPMDLRLFGGSALTDDIPVPKSESVDDLEDGIPVTYVPARNTIFLSYALACAEVVDARHVFIGVNAIDYSGYPDCRPEYIEAFQAMANLATKAGVEARGVRIHTPLSEMRKADIIRRGLELGVDYGRTVSCYDPTADGAACGHCDACLLRLEGFRAAGASDGATYV